MSFSTEKQTKAEQLADVLDPAECMCTTDEAEAIAEELRRLSPMEAQLMAKRDFVSQQTQVLQDYKNEVTHLEAQLADEKLHVKQLERGLDKLLAVNKVLVGALKKTRLLILVSDFRDSQQAQLKEVLNESKEALKLAGEIK
jgi:predicted RNase H-like nuclease (RuvC/YqgF family)